MPKPLSFARGRRIARGSGQKLPAAGRGDLLGPGVSPERLQPYCAQDACLQRATDSSWLLRSFVSAVLGTLEFFVRRSNAFLARTTYDRGEQNSGEGNGSRVNKGRHCGCASKVASNVPTMPRQTTRAEDPNLDLPFARCIRFALSGWRALLQVSVKRDVGLCG